jgi:energy-coupling factor transport system permease protein
MLSDVAFGQYYPVSSPVHRLDPRTKIVILIAYIVMIFLIKNFVGFVFAGAFLLATIIIAKVPIGSVIKSVKAILFIIIITFIINLFLHKEEGSKVLFDVWLLNKITDKSIKFISM